MKRFYYRITSARRRNLGGTIVKANVIKATKNKLSSIGEVSWNTASYRGPESEVFNFLIKKGELPKKLFKASESPMQSGGYYNWSIGQRYGFSIEQM